MTNIIVRSNEFLSGLNDREGRYEWMKEKRYNTMFRDIEAKIQGGWVGNL